MRTQSATSAYNNILLFSLSPHFDSHTVQFNSTIATIAALSLIGNLCHAFITRFNSGSAGALALCESPCESGVVST